MGADMVTPGWGGDGCRYGHTMWRGGGGDGCRYGHTRLGGGNGCHTMCERMVPRCTDLNVGDTVPIALDDIFSGSVSTVLAHHNGKLFS